MSPEELARIFQPLLAEDMVRSNAVPPAKYPEALAGSAVHQSLVAQTPILGWADVQSVAKPQLLETTLLQPSGLLKALEAFPIALGVWGCPLSNVEDVVCVKDMPAWAKLSATVYCRHVK
jgi:hypothetical protein